MTVVGDEEGVRLAYPEARTKQKKAPQVGGAAASISPTKRRNAQQTLTPPVGKVPPSDKGHQGRKTPSPLKTKRALDWNK
mmetsp:Transcript_25074/g.48807  ORF Transcript_25074/g.48807 Transcript_25074/m.48807 type:complete len:80 (-) Transcript_25074:329-568(-)